MDLQEQMHVMQALGPLRAWPAGTLTRAGLPLGFSRSSLFTQQRVP